MTIKTHKEYDKLIALLRGLNFEYTVSVKGVEYYILDTDENSYEFDVSSNNIAILVSITHNSLSHLKDYNNTYHSIEDCIVFLKATFKHKLRKYKISKLL